MRPFMHFLLQLFAPPLTTDQYALYVLDLFSLKFNLRHLMQAGVPSRVQTRLPGSLC